MTVQTILRLWNNACDEYCQEVRRLYKRIVKHTDETKPRGEQLDDLIETLG